MTARFPVLAKADAVRCGQLLPAVSRTFSLTIRVLPPRLRQTVTVAYLLCRMADILEDATRVDPRPRRAALLQLAEALAAAGQDGTVLADSAELLNHSLDRADSFPGLDTASRALLDGRASVFRSFLALAPTSRGAVARWVETMAQGMAEFVTRELPGNATKDGVVPGQPPFRLQTPEELRSYAYYVAGTVGRLLTELFTDHLDLGENARTARLRELAVPFGLGLQFTNILQDLAEDRIRGWSYIPEDLARRRGTSLARLQDENQRPAALRVVADLIEEASLHLDQAMEFTLLIPRSAPRVRLFCLWPIFFARGTLVHLWGEPAVLGGVEKVRISRHEVRKVMRQTVLGCLSNDRLEHLYNAERRRLEERMALCPL